MRRDPWNVVGLAFALSLVMVAGCGGGSGDDDDDDACAGKVLCTVEGTSCDGDDVVTCAQDGAGCLVETVEDCAAGGQVCDDTGADAMCVDGECSDDTQCDGATDGDTYCDGDVVVTCAAGADGCLDASTEDCAAAGDACDDSAAPAICVCADDTECAGASDGDSFCSGDSTVDCNVDGDGCLVATVVDCSAGGQTCDDSGADAVCVGGCTDHASCTGATDGDTSCDGYLLNTCTDTDADGCLDLVQESCAPALCDDTATPEACGVLAATGETCADPIPVLASAFVLSGADITTDFADDHTLGDASCSATGGASADVVFSIDLMTGDTVVVNETGGLDSTRNIQTTCGDAGVCLATIDDPEGQPLSYTATADETVFIIVESYFAAPATTDYSIEIALNPTCGNGLVEAGEACDDGDVADGNGCSAACAIEFGYSCDGLSPTSCDAFPDLGSFGAGDTIADTVNSELVPAGASDFYTITFTEDVLLSGTLVANTTGDPDFFMFNEAGTAGHTAAVDGNEAWNGVFIPAGQYVIVVNIYEPAGDAGTGYTLAMSTEAITDLGTIGDGGTVTETGGALAAGSSEIYTITFSEDVLLSGTLVGSSGADMDLFILGAEGFVTQTADDFDETFGIALLAGTYTFEINAWSGAADATSWTLDVSAAALAVTDIGTFAAEDTIGDTVGGAITARVFDHYTITFSEDVLLSGTLGGNTTGEVGIRLYDAGAALISQFNAGDETITGVAVPAGTYVVQVLTVSAAFGGGDVDGYTLSLTADAP